MRAFRFILSALLVLFLTGVLVVFTMFLNQRKMMYFPPMNIPQSEFANLSGFDPVHVRAQDGLDLTGYYKPPRDEKKPIILAFHGNASHPVWMVSRFQRLIEDGYGVLLAEYRGYGENGGYPNEEGFYLDARAYMEFLAKNKNPIVFYGSSLGTGVAVQLAIEQTPAALILETPFDSMLNVAKHHYPFVPFVEYFLKDQFHSIEKIKKVKAPIFFIVAGQDEVVPSRLAHNLFENANEPKQLVVLPAAQHNTTYDHDAENKVFDFLRTLFP